jgi:hypothetical protein
MGLALEPLTRREHEILVTALYRYADIERSDGNTILSSLLIMLARYAESRPLRGQKEVA